MGGKLEDHGENLERREQENGIAFPKKEEGQGKELAKETKGFWNQIRRGDEEKAEHLIVLSVLMRIQWGMGRFCLIFFASFFLILKVLCDGYHKEE